MKAIDKHTNYISVKTINPNQSLNLLIDTGADISICKENFINSDFINTCATCKFTGITNEEIFSTGKINLKLLLEEEIIEHEFAVVQSDFPIATDGIIGRDLLTRLLGKIDYETFTVTLLTESQEIIIPMYSKIPEINTITIPKRSEVIIPISLDRQEDRIILNKELQQGIFVSNTIIPAKGICHIKILNTNSEDAKLQHINLDSEPLENYKILNYSAHHTTVRLEKLLTTINTQNIDEKDKIELLNTIEDYQDIFHLEGDKLTTNNFYTQQLNISDNNPTYIKNYRLPQSHHDEINRQVQGLLDEDIIEPSYSPYNSPLLIVPKKDEDNKKKWRLVVDFRKLNTKLINDKFPLTRLEDVLDVLGRAKYFSTLDMTSSFHQIPLDKKSRPLTAFSTPNGHYQFTRLPFGLKISSNSFQRMLTIALTGLTSEAFLYVDDIIVFGCSIKHHNNNLITVFNRLRKYNLKLNAKKCNFLQTEVVYLGHLITNKGIQTDPAKNKVIRDYPVPKNTDEVRRFVAFCNYYRRFIKNFAEIAKCLNKLLQKKQQFIWSEECQNAFIELKEKLLNPPILQYPNFENPFIVTTDASNYALGAILSQGEIGDDLPISYASTSLKKHDLNKPVIEKELLAIHWGINYFKPYLYGRKFTVVTDHRPLVSLFTHKNPSSKMTRIRMDLADYDFNIVYKQGKMNTNADALSRIEIDSDMLKSMIPSGIDTKIPKKILVTTRGMIKKNKVENHTSQEPDQLYIWDCTSTADVRNTTKLTFEILGNMKHAKVVQSHNDNPSNQDSFLEKLSTNIYKNKDEFIVRFSEDQSKLDSILEKLTSITNNMKIKELAMKNNDDILSTTDFKERYSAVQRKLKNENKPTLNILIYKPPKRINKMIEIYKLIDEHHSTYHGGHYGIRKTILKLKQNYVWKNMRQTVKEFVNSCSKCATNKQIRHTKEQMIETDTPTTSFETIAIDTVGPLRLSNGYRYILTMQCELTKYIIAHPMPSKDATTIAKTMVEQLILKHGHFKTLKSDRGTEFKNELLKEICTLLDIKQVFSTPYHHETLGVVERSHRVLNEFILNFCEDNEWDKWIPYFTFAYNITPNIDTEYSPFELVYGKIAYVSNEINNDKQPIYNLENYKNELKLRLNRALARANALITITKRNRINKNKNFNKLNINVDDLVLLKNYNNKKGQPPYKGPYRVIRTNGVNTSIQMENSIKEVHNNILKRFSPSKPIS